MDLIAGALIMVGVGVGAYCIYTKYDEMSEELDKFRGRASELEERLSAILGKIDQFVTAQEQAKA